MIRKAELEYYIVHYVSSLTLLQFLEKKFSFLSFYILSKGINYKFNFKNFLYKRIGIKINKRKKRNKQCSLLYINTKFPKTNKCFSNFDI